MTINKEVTCCNFIYCLIMRRLLVTFTSTLFVLTIFESVGSSPYSKNIEGNYKTEPDHETGAKVAQWTKEMKMNPEELGNYFQGDIMLSNRTTRNGDANPFSRWPNRVIPYTISGNFNQDQRNMIFRAIDEFHRKTCIRFVPWNGHNDFIDFQNENIGCWSWIGRQGGRQKVNLQTPGCTYYVGTAIHEINHAIGFWHEHTREDRDNYVSINWNNIQRDQQYNFVKASPGQTVSYNVGYDYKSVMHYSEYSHAINPNIKTMVPTNPPDATIIGERSGLSNGDVLKINRMYGC